MIRYEEAVAKIKQVAQGKFLADEPTPISEATGRIAAQNVFAPKLSPPFDNSAMDGFAVLSAQTVGASGQNPITFQIVDSLAAGNCLNQTQKIDPHAAIEIMTGAPIPRHLGFDAVFKKEDIRHADDQIEITRPILPGENIRLAGEDMRENECILSKKDRLFPEHIMAMASVGISKISVFKKPRIAIISTGKELTSHEVSHLENGHIYNSTAPYLTSALAQMGALPQFYGTVADNADDFIALLLEIIQENPDLIISTGAVSVGNHDFIRAALEKMKATIHFHKVAVRPGKPMLFAELKSENSHVPFLGFPGNPVPAATGLRFFVDPYLRYLHGIEHEKPILARVLNDMEKPKELRCFFKAKLLFHDNQACTQLLLGQESFKIKPMLAANAWAVLPEEKQFIRKNDFVELFPFLPLRTSS